MSISKYACVFENTVICLTVMQSAVRMRMTRDESRALTRERLLDAAHELIIRKGVEATSIEEVTELAGYSRGAFYSNFETKEDLVCALIERDMARVNAELTELYSLPLTPQERLQRTRDYYIEVSSDPKTCVFWMAMELYALRDPQAHSRVVELLWQDRQNVVKFVRMTFAEQGKEPPLPVEVMAFGLIAYTQGLALSTRVHPNEITTEQVRQSLGLYFDRMIG